MEMPAVHAAPVSMEIPSTVTYAPVPGSSQAAAPITCAGSSQAAAPMTSSAAASAAAASI